MYVYVCMYVYMNVCMHDLLLYDCKKTLSVLLYMCVNMYTYMYMYVSLLNANKCICMYVCMYAFTTMWIPYCMMVRKPLIHMCESFDTHIHTYTHIHTHIRIYIYTYTYTHTHIHTKRPHIHSHTYT